ncbi:MAG TPA: SH3 domain-containing protein [Micromonosporaceae bacterium]
MTPLVRTALAGVLAAAGITAVVLAVAPHRVAGPADSGTEYHLVLVSGRDDHGLLATPQVVLRDRPGDGAPVGRVPDGTLARVVATRGTWLEVRTAEGPSVDGWVDDFYLRGVVHLVGPAPTCAVTLDGRSLPAGEQAVVLDLRGGRARVRVARTGRTGWVDRASVQELAPSHGCDGTPD